MVILTILSNTDGGASLEVAAGADETAGAAMVRRAAVTDARPMAGAEDRAMRKIEEGNILESW